MSIEVIDGKGVKNDDDRPRYDLVPADAQLEVAKVMAFGAKKYGERNWERGMPWHKPFRAALSHLYAFWRGEEKDSESGLSHLAHAACSVLFLLAYALRRAHARFDDRECQFGRNGAGAEYLPSHESTGKAELHPAEACRMDAHPIPKIEREGAHALHINCGPNPVGICKDAGCPWIYTPHPGVSDQIASIRQAHRIHRASFGVVAIEPEASRV